jgi:predicted transcriptional regulator of viral defense system
MKLLDLYKIEKDYFDHREIARVLNIKSESARVLANRYVKKNILIRAKRDMYMFRDRWYQFDLEKRFEIANLLQVPSYISFMTALSYYEVTTQMQVDYIESVALKRTTEIEIENTLFTFSRIKEKLYYEFSKTNNFFIATPEKALVDALYLMSLGRYRLDLSAIDKDKLDQKRLEMIAGKFPEQTITFMRTNGYLSKA